MPQDNGSDTPQDRQLRVFFAKHNSEIDSLITAFESELRDLVDRARARTLAKLQAKLSITAGVIDPTPANQRIMRSINLLFQQEMDALGYDKLVQSFVGQFGKQVTYARELIQIVAPGADITFDDTDKAWFASQQLSAVDSITSAVDVIGTAAQQRALFTVAGYKVADLAELLSERLGKTVLEASRIADTAVTVFHRSIAERGFAKIEADLPQLHIRYKYMGPDDKLTRPFCRRLVESGRSYSREEIDQMDNHQLPNPFLTCGGINCRHIFVLASQSVNPDYQPPAAAAQPIAA